MTRIYFMGITKMGCVIQNAMVTVPEDYTMLQLVRAIKANGYTAFMVPGMKRFVNIEKEIEKNGKIA